MYYVDGSSALYYEERPPSGYLVHCFPTEILPAATYQA